MTLFIFFSVFFITLIISAPIVFSLALSAVALLWNRGMLVRSSWSSACLLASTPSL